MPLTPFLARRERFARVGSTNDVVRAWLRSEGHCENPHCTGEAQDITDAGGPAGRQKQQR